jgi:hypothetical protein
MVSTMASRKKSDGGAERAKGRQRAQNKKTEAKYGLQGFTAQANKNLQNPRYIPTAKQSGMGIIEASGFGAAPSVGRAVAKVASSSRVIRAVQAVSRRVLPKEVGIHHSVTGPDGKLFRGTVRPSGKQGRTAMDQIPGNSYFWSTKGKGGPAKAAKEAEFQTRNIAENWILDEGTRASAYVTKVPRGTSMPDMNVPGSRARTVVGGQQIVRGVAGTGPVSRGTMSSLSASDLAKLTAGVKRAKAFEAASSTAKIAGIVATPSFVAGRALQAGTPNSSRNTKGRQSGGRTSGRAPKK